MVSIALFFLLVRSANVLLAYFNRYFVIFNKMYNISKNTDFVNIEKKDCCFHFCMFFTSETVVFMLLIKIKIL